MRYFATISVILIGLAFLTRAQSPDTKPPEKHPATTQSVERVLFDRVVGQDGQHLVVIQGADRNPSLLRYFVEPMPARPYDSVHEIRVELRTVNEAPFILASKVFGQYNYSYASEGPLVKVLDALVERTGVVIGFVDGISVMIWQIPFTRPTAWCVPVSEGDSPAAFRAPSRDCKMIISRKEDGRLSYEMIVLNQFHSTYEQNAPNDLIFEMKSESQRHKSIK